MILAKLRGVFPVPLTPFNESDQLVDYGRLRDHVEFMVNAGVHGLVVNGSTSEFPMLSRDECIEVARTIIDQANGRVSIVFGASAPSSEKTLDYCKIAEDIGADALMMLPPYYFPLSDDEILKHYEIVSSATKLPIMLYNNPGTSKIDIKPELVAKLAEIDNIAYIKESSGELARIREIKYLAGDKIEVFIGADIIFFDALVAGATGVVASCGNVIPGQMAEIFRLVADENDVEEGRKKFNKIFPFCAYADGNPQFVQVLKTALDIMGKPVGPPRFPLLKLSAKDREELAERMRASGLC
jgi:4-hydroxy-tetrahydrodipicolinate synthase